MTNMSPEHAARVRSLIQNATKTQRRSTHRHPAEVTADRVKEATERWYDKMTGAERDACADVIQALEEIANGQR